MEYSNSAKNNLPPNWSWVKLGDVIDKISTTGIKLKQKEYLQEGKFPVIDQGKELIGGYSNNKNLIVDCELPVIVFGDHTKVKKFIDFKFIAGADGAIIIKPKEIWDAKLFYYFLHCIKFPDKGYARHFQFVEKAVIPLPPLSEQKKIVEKIEELFSGLDSGVGSLKKAKAQIRLYRQSVLASAFSGRLTRKDDISSRDVIFSSKAAEPKPEYSNQLPNGWKWVKLGEVAEVKRGKSKHRPRNDPKLYGGNYPFIQTGEIRSANGGIINTFNQTYNEIGLAQSKLWPKGTLCVSIAANIGETAFLGFDACFPDSIVGIVPIKDILYGKFVNYFLIKEKERISELAPATAQKNINVDILQKLNIPLPPIAKQLQIVEEIEKRFSEADNLEKAIDDSLAKAETLRQSILKQAFEGRLV